MLFASRPCNCGLYNGLMQTWQVQNTALKSKYRLSMLLGMHLEYKTAQCTVKTARLGIRGSWHVKNKRFLFSFSWTCYVCLAVWRTTLVITIASTVTPSYGITYPVFSGFVTLCHTKRVLQPTPVSIWQASFHSEPIFFFQGLQGSDSRLRLCCCSAEAWYWSV